MPKRTAPARQRRTIDARHLGLALALLVSACAGSGDLEAERQAKVAEDPAAMMRIADAAERSGDTGGAVAFYRRAAELQPDLVDAQVGTARSLVEQGNVDEAVDILRAAHARDPSDTQLPATLGRLLMAANRPIEALSSFRDGLRQDPRSIPLLIGRGVALDATGQHEGAQSSYKEVLGLAPENPAARKNLALSLSLSQHGKKAARPSSADTSSNRPENAPAHDGGVPSAETAL